MTARPVEHAAPVLAGVDRAAFAVALVGRLRTAGVRVPLDRAGVLSDALAVCPPDDRGRLYWVARTTLVARPADVPVFDAVFAGVFDAAMMGVVAPPVPVDTPLPVAAGAELSGDAASVPWSTRRAAIDTAAGSDVEPRRGHPHRRPSAVAADTAEPFPALDDASARRLVAAAAWPTRSSRRRRIPSSRGPIDLRATLARSRRTGGVPMALVRARPTRRPRRLVVVCDVSQSMQPYVTAYLHLMRALARHRDAEVFAFGTSLTRLTAVLAHHRVDVAVTRAGDVVTDRFGGTRLGSSLLALLSSRHGDATRGAVVVIASDGWDSDPPELTARAMSRLRRRAHRIVWLNPRAASSDFEPHATGMATALPYVDTLIPAADLASLTDVVGLVAD